MFLILLTYTRPLAEIDALVPAHREYLDRYYAAEVFVCSGARTPRTGGVILARAASEERVWEIVREDPFHQAGVADYEVIGFEPTKYDARFEPFVGTAR